MSATAVQNKLALLGGEPCVTGDHRELFHWPIVTQEHEDAVLEVLRSGRMSAWDITQEFEAEFADYVGTRYALASPNGTASLIEAMFGCKVGRGDEIIAPSMTFWSTALPAFNLGATPVFADIEPDSLCIDPNDIEHRITERTKAIIPVHYCGHPADMDPIMEIARRHGVKVIEDVSHAQGGFYKGRKVGTFGDVGAMSMMSGKSFAIGEAGMLCTDDQEIYERAVSFGHYEQTGTKLTLPDLKPWIGVPVGAYKNRLNQLNSAMGRVQLKLYPNKIQEIQDAMNYFWDELEGLPGIRAHRPPEDSGSTMAGWYASTGLYVPEELGGLSVSKFREAVSAEGSRCGRGCNNPLHLHHVLNEADLYGDGKPTRIAFADRDLRQPAGSLPVTEALPERCYSVPWFKHDRRDEIDQYITAYRKVIEQADQLL